MHSSSLGPLHSLPPSTSRSRRPRRPSPPERGSRRSSVFKPGPFPLILMHGCPLYRVPSPGHPCSVGTILLGLSPFLCIPVLANRSYSSGTAEVSTKTVTSWSNALDAHNEDQCGLFDVGAPRYDQCGPLDAPNDNAPNKPVFASPEASATVCIGITRTYDCPECSPCIRALLHKILSSQRTALTPGHTV